MPKNESVEASNLNGEPLSPDIIGSAPALLSVYRLVRLNPRGGTGSRV